MDHPYEGLAPMPAPAPANAQAEEEEVERPPGCPGYSLGFRLVRTSLIKIVVQRQLTVSTELSGRVFQIAGTLCTTPIAGTNAALANALFYCLGGLSSTKGAPAGRDAPEEVACVDTDGDTVAFKRVVTEGKTILEKWVNGRLNKAVVSLGVSGNSVGSEDVYPDIRDQDGWGGKVARRGAGSHQDLEWLQNYLIDLKWICAAAGVRIVGLEYVKVPDKPPADAIEEPDSPPADALLWSHLHWVPSADVGARAVAAQAEQPVAVAERMLTRYGSELEATIALTQAIVVPKTADIFRPADCIEEPSSKKLLSADEGDKDTGNTAENTALLFRWCEAGESKHAGGQNIKVAPAAHCLDALAVQYARVLAAQLLPTVDGLDEPFTAFAPLFVGSEAATPLELFDKGHPQHGLGARLKAQLKTWVGANPNNRIRALEFVELLLAQASVRRHVEPSLSSHYTKHPDASMETFYSASTKPDALSVDRVVAISGRAGWFVDAVTFHLQSGKTLGYGKESGGSATEKFELSEGEYLTKVVQRRLAVPQYFGNAFVFTTSRGRCYEIAGSRASDSNYAVENNTLKECAAGPGEEITALMVATPPTPFGHVDGVVTAVYSSTPVCEDSYKGKPNLPLALYLIQTLVDTVSDAEDPALWTTVRDQLFALLCKVPSEELAQTLLALQVPGSAQQIAGANLSSTMALANALHKIEETATAKRKTLTYSPLLTSILEVLSPVQPTLPDGSIDGSVTPIWREGWAKAYAPVVKVLASSNLALPSDASWYMRQSSQASTASASWCWGNEREMSTTEITDDGRAVWKTSDSPDYSVCLGTTAFPKEGIYEFTVQFSGNARGVAVGVCTALDEAERARAIWRVPRDSGTQKSAWYMRSSGEIAQLRPGADYSTTVIETEYEIKTQPDRDTITMVSNTSHHSWVNQAPECCF